MNWIQGAKFLMNETEYTIQSVWHKKGKKTCYEFKDKKGNLFAMPAQVFEEKVNETNYIGI